VRLRDGMLGPVGRYLVESLLSLWESKKFGNKDRMVGDNDFKPVLIVDCASKVLTRASGLPVRQRRTAPPRKRRLDGPRPWARQCHPHSLERIPTMVTAQLL
jgi:hypothetical protein